MASKGSIAKEGIFILITFFLLASSSFCYGESNDNYIESLSSYKDHLEQINNKLDAGGSSLMLMKEHARENVMGFISYIQEALREVEQNIDSEILDLEISKINDESNSVRIASLSNYKNRIEQINSELYAGGSSLTEGHAREEAMGIISYTQEALRGLEREIELEIFKRK